MFDKKQDKNLLRERVHDKRESINSAIRGMTSTLRCVWWKKTSRICVVGVWWRCRGQWAGWRLVNHLQESRLLVHEFAFTRADACICLWAAMKEDQKSNNNDQNSSSDRASDDCRQCSRRRKWHWIWDGKRHAHTYSKRTCTSTSIWQHHCAWM